MESNEKRIKKSGDVKGKRSFEKGGFTGQGHEISFDFKNVELLKRYISDRGKIVPARISKLSSKQQRALARAIKRSRQVALLPYSGGHWSTIFSKA